MSQCLRCSKPCETTSVFCETCRSLLRSQLWQAANTGPEEPILAAPPVVVMSSENGGVNGDSLERIMDSHSLAGVSQLPASQIGFPQTPQPPPSSLPGTYASTPEHDALLSELFREGEGQREQPTSPLVPVSQTEMAATKGNGDIGSIVDQALRRLREAAQRIAEVEQGS